MKDSVLLVFASTLLSTTVFLGFVRPVVAQGPIYIVKGVDPLTDKIRRDGVKFTFTDNISNFIVVESDGIVIDGAGFTVVGTGEGAGINLTGRRDVTIKNLVVENFYDGIYLSNSNGSSISGNIIRDNKNVGIILQNSFNNNISRVNKVIRNSNGGVHLKDSYNNIISGNTIEDNGAGFDGDGISLSDSSNNDLSENVVTRNKYAGIHLLEDSDHNMITNNNVSNSKYGIRIKKSIDCILRDNNISNNNPIGIFLSLRCTLINNFVLTENYISNNGVGLWIWGSNGTTVYHNKFLNNSIHVSLFDSHNTIWDNDSEGNYWDNYRENYMAEGGIDDKSFDIGDEPYYIDETNQDSYPLVAKGIITSPFWMEWWFWTASALIVMMVILSRRYIKQRMTDKAYKRQLETSRLLFKDDVDRRKQRIEEFEEKYGIHIRRLEDDLEDLLERIGIKKKEE